MLCMLLDLLSWVVGGLMSSFTHAVSFCSHAARPCFSFSAHTHVHFPICLFFDLPSHLLLRHLDRAFKAPFFSSTPEDSGKKIVVQTTDVRCDPRPRLPFLRNVMFPTLWHNLTMEISLKEHWWSFVQLWTIRFLSCVSVLIETFHPKMLRFRCVDSFEGASDRSCLWPFPLWHGDKWARTHSQPPAQVSHTGSVTVDLLRRQEYHLISAWIPTQQRNKQSLLDRVRWRYVCLMALFPGKCPLSWIRSLKRVVFVIYKQSRVLIAGLR